MSMLTAQMDELRKYAALFEGYPNGKISGLLREAADTIEGMRDRLQADVLECWWAEADAMELPDGKWIRAYVADCGARHTWYPEGLPNYCPTCGRKVKR